MGAKVGVRIDVEAAKGKRAVRDFSKAATADLEKVRQKGQAANKALIQGQNKLAASTGNLRQSMRPLGEGMESLNMLMGNTGTQAGSMGAAMIRLAAGPMGILTAAIGVGIGALVMWIGKSQEAAKVAEEEARSIRGLGAARAELARKYLSPEVRLRNRINALIQEEGDLLVKNKRRTTGRPGRYSALGGLPAPTNYKAVAAEILEIGQALTKTSAGFARMTEIIEEASTVGRFRAKDILGAIQEMTSPETDAALGSITSRLHDMARGFEAANDPVKKIALQFERLEENLRKTLPTEKLMTAAQKEALAVEIKRLHAMRDRAIETAKFAKFMASQKVAITPDFRAADAATERERLRQQENEYQWKLRRMEEGFAASQVPVVGQPAFGPAPVKRTASAATETFAQDTGAAIETSLSDGIYDGITTGFKNGADIAEQFAASLQRALSDALAQGITESLGLDAGSIAGGLAGLFGGGSAGSNSAGGIT